MKNVKFSLTLLLFVSLFSGKLLFAQSTLIEKVEPTSNPLIIPFEKWKLSNGLTLIIQEDHSNPIVSVVIGYHVGSARESIGKSGFAHFFEHMMFGPSEHVKSEEHFKLVSEEGGTMNGGTESDKTVYFETVPSNYLETALWLEADRMGFLLDSVTKERFEIQRATVKNEKGQRTENVPYGLVDETKDQILYPPGHPYSWPVIGYTDDLDRVNVDDLRSFFLRWYGPNNAILVVAGDVNPKEVLAMTEKYFGSIPAGPEVKKARASVPILSFDKYANYMDNVYVPLTYMVYPTVPAYHRDEPAIDMMAAMMGQGKNSVFYKNFDKTEKGSASVSQENSELSGELGIQAITYPDYDDINPEEIPQDKDGRARWQHEFSVKNFNETEKLIHKTIDEFEQTGITQDALDRAKAKRESAIVNETGTDLGKANLLLEWQMMLGKPYNLQDEMDRYDKVTLEDITRVFNKYVKDKHVAIVNVFPKDDPESTDTTKSFNPNANIPTTPDPQYAGLKYVKAKDNFDRSQKPPAGPPKTPVVPVYYTDQLKNGIKIIGTQNATTPTVVILITIKGGDLVYANDPKKVGLAAFTAEMMNEGTQKYTSEQFEAELDKLGSRISFGAGGENTSITVTCLTKNLDATLTLLEEKLLRPRFDAEDFKRINKEYRESLYQEKKDASYTADALFKNLIYGNTIQGSYPTVKNIKKFSLDDIKDYYHQYYSPSVTNIVIVGDVTEADVMKKLDFLNKWQGKDVKIPTELAAFPPIEKTQIYFADKEGAAQSVIRIGNPALAYDYAGDFFKARILNFPLGGSFNSRLNLNIREDKGWTYGMNSSFTGSKYPGYFAIESDVKRSATDSCIAEVMKELKDYTANGIKDDELTFTKSALLNSEALKYESPFQKASFLSAIIAYNLPKDFKQTQSKVLRDVTKSELDELTKKYIHPDKMVILIVGNRYLTKNKLEKLGFGNIKDVKLD